MRIGAHLNLTIAISRALMAILANCAAGPVALAGGFDPGSLAVVRVGDGAAGLSSSAAPVFIEERLASGSLQSTVPLPTIASGANRRLTVTGTAASEAYLTRSSNGQYLVVIGYDAPVGQPTVSATTTAVANRVIGRITIADATVNTTTAMSDLTFNTGNPRSAVTDNGARFWCSGVATPASSGGVRFVASLGATTSTQVSATTTNTRVLNIFNNGAQDQLFVSSAVGTLQGVSTIGSGVPASGFPVTITLLNGFPTTTGPSSHDFFLASPTTLYVADDRAPPSGGVQKWTLAGGVWSLAYTLNVNLTTGCRGLTGTIGPDGHAVLYATTATLTANNIVTVTDTGVASPFASIATAPTNTGFRGIRLIPNSSCAGDVNGDNDVDVDDLIAVILQWGSACPCTADVTGDGAVDVEDLVTVILNWGPCA